MGKSRLLWVTPKDPAAPTVAELEAGIDLAPYVTTDGWEFTRPADRSLDLPPSTDSEDS